jgi:hypothetical protein
MGIFSSLKDNLSSFSGEQVVRKYIEPYGELLDFKINSSEKTMLIKALLKGEKEPVEIKVNRYEVNEQDGRMFVKVHDVRTSREWLTKFAQDYLLSQRFEIPGQYINIVKKFL